MDYQEKVCSSREIEALYKKVLQMPNVVRYRGYDEVGSYCWDPHSETYTKVKGERWWYNPGYDPGCDAITLLEEDTSRSSGVDEYKKTVDELSALSLEELYKKEDLRAMVKEAPEFKQRFDSIDEMHEVPCDMQFVTSKKPNEPRVLDSGHRRQFESGAVRDICEGKGRCDLLPLDVVGHALANPTFKYIHQFQVEDGDYERLYDALSSSGVFHDYYTLILEVAKQFEDGAKKYGDDNWQKGIPTHCYIDSAVRHYLKYLRGDKDEPHDRAFCWNILCCIWTCIHKPELNDYAPKEEKDA